VQPNHQVIEVQLGIDGRRRVVAENAAAPSATAPKVNGIGAGNMPSHRADRRSFEADGEAHFGTFATASMDRSAAPKEHARRDRAEGSPILSILHEGERASRAQDQLDDFRR